MTAHEDAAKRLFGELWTVMHSITRGVEAELKPFGLTHAQFQVLLHVVGRPDLSQRELAERLNLTTGGVSMLVSKLEAAGLLERVPDGAAVRLRVTDAGRTRFAELGPTRERFLRELVADVDEADLRHAADVLHRLRRP